MADRGRPPSYTDELADEFLDRIAHGQSMRSICKLDHMPSCTTVIKWLKDKEDFLERYARAREAQADYLAEETIEIADDATNDWMENNDPDNPGWKANGEHIQRSRLRVDARKWFASKVAPKKYGDIQKIEHSGGITKTVINAEIDFDKYLSELASAKANGRPLPITLDNPSPTETNPA